MTVCIFSLHLVTTKMIGFNLAKTLRFSSGKLLPQINTVLRKVYISKIGEDEGESKVWKHDKISNPEAFNHLQFQ